MSHSDEDRGATSEKTITLRPSVKSMLPGIALGVLLIPILIGVYILFRQYRKFHTTGYLISDRAITVRTENTEECVDLENIHKSDVEQGWLGRKLGFGDVFLKTNTRTVRLNGLEDPDQISQMILTAAENERQRLAEMNRRKPRKPQHPAGTADRLDYLTGLWQQGLLSNEDYKKEKKHFE
jgi:hypothetical protein